MERKAEAQVLPALHRPQRRDIGLSLSRRPQRAGADPIEFEVVRDAEDREQAVAHELQHLPALGLDRRHEVVEKQIEQFDQRRRRHRVGAFREAAHVGEPDHRANCLAVAAADAPRQNALARVASDISVQQVDRGPAQPADLGDPRQRRAIASIATICPAVKPPGSRVVKLALWISPLVKRSGIAR